MAFWDFLRKKKRDGRENNGRDFTDEEREEARLSRARNTIRKERIKMLEDEVEELRHQREERKLLREKEMLERDLHEDEYDDEEEEEDDEENPDDIFGGMMGKVIQAIVAAKAAQAMPAPQQAAQPPQKRTYSDEELKAMFEKVPEVYRKKLRQMSDEEIVEQMRAHVPDFFHSADDDTIARAILVVKA